MELSNKDIEELRVLEESLWIAQTRFDKDYMDKILSEDFFEFGRSGKIYKREETLLAAAQEIDAQLPLKDFKVHQISSDVVLVTYISEVKYENLEIGNRSSLWVKKSEGWKLKFHQGTIVKQD